MKKQQFINFIEWIGGPVSPMLHPDYYELNITDDNFIPQIENYFDTQRRILYKEKGKGLLNIIKQVIHEPITKQEFEKLRISEDDFNYEFGKLLEIFKGSKEGNELLEILHKVVLNTDNRLFIIYMLSYLYNAWLSVKIGSTKNIWAESHCFG